jgi:hypothetical protein
MTGYTYDTGGLVAAERGSRTMWARHKHALLRGVTLTVPAVVLAQAWRGGPQPLLSRLLQGCEVQGVDESTARTIGAACAATQTRDIVDVAVIVGALARGDIVVTSDVDDLRRIADGLGAHVELVRPDQA